MQKSIKLSSVQTDLPIELQHLWVGEIVFYAWAVFHLDKGPVSGSSNRPSDGSGHLPAFPPVRDKGARKYTDSMAANHELSVDLM